MNDLCVLFFGDSFVAGSGDESGLGWVGRVAATAWGEGLPLTSYNLGVRGENTDDLSRRLVTEAMPRVIPEADNRVVIAVGANDVASDPALRPLSEQQSVRAMEAILNGVQLLGATAFVVGPGPARDAAHDEASRELSARFGALCAARETPYLEVLDDLLADPDWNAEAEAADGIHAGAKGHAALARLVSEGGLLDWLRDRRPG